MKERAISDSNISIEYNDFLISFLMTKKSGKGRISQLLLDKNGIKATLADFIYMQSAVKDKRANITHKGYNYYTFKITQQGIIYSSILPTTNKIIPLTLLERINLYVLKRILKSISVFFVSANKTMNKIMKSWIIGFILFIAAILMLLAEYDNIIKFFSSVFK